MSWADVKELVVDVVEIYSWDTNRPYDLYELEDHLLDYAAGLDEEQAGLLQIRLKLLDEAFDWDTERWLEMIMREHEHVRDE